MKLKDQTVQVIRTSLASVMLFRCFTLDSMVVIVAVPGFNFKFLGVTEVPLTTFKTEMIILCVCVCVRERERESERERERDRDRKREKETERDREKEKETEREIEEDRER